MGPTPPPSLQQNSSTPANLNRELRYDRESSPTRSSPTRSLQQHHTLGGSNGIPSLQREVPPTFTSSTPQEPRSDFRSDLRNEPRNASLFSSDDFMQKFQLPEWDKSKYATSVPAFPRYDPGDLDFSENNLKPRIFPTELTLSSLSPAMSSVRLSEELSQPSIVDALHEFESPIGNDPFFKTPGEDASDVKLRSMQTALSKFSGQLKVIR